MNNERIKIGDIISIFSHVDGVENRIGKVQYFHMAKLVVVKLANGNLSSNISLQRCSHATDDERKQYFKGRLQSG